MSVEELYGRLSIGFAVGAGGIGSVFMGGISDIFGVTTVFTFLSLLPLAGSLIALFLPSDWREKKRHNQEKSA